MDRAFLVEKNTQIEETMTLLKTCGKLSNERIGHFLLLSKRWIE